MKDRFDRFSYALTEIYRHWHKIASQVMGEYGLKGSCSVYFTAMRGQKDGLTASKLSELSGRNKSDVSRMISQMIQKGFVRKEKVGNKSYRAKLFLTEDGNRVADHIYERAKVAVDFGGLGLDSQQRDGFFLALELIANNLRMISTEGIYKFGNQPILIEG